MKKTLIFLLLSALCTVACKKDKVDVWVDNSPIIDFKDPRFLDALMEISETNNGRPYTDGQKAYTTFKDMNGDGKVSEKEAARVQYLDLDGQIKNISEISYFTSLEVLICSDNDIREIDVTKNTMLTGLDCSNNSISYIDISKNKTLVSLDCSINEFQSIDVSECKELKTLNCANNRITRLGLDECSALEDLDCNSNSLTTLNLSDCTELRSLDCSFNSISVLDLSLNKNLRSISCTENPLRRIILYEYAKLPESFLNTYKDMIEGYLW